MGMDLYQFVETRGSSEKAMVRLLYTPLSHPDIPVLPITLGSSLAGLLSIVRVNKSDPESVSTKKTDDSMANSKVTESKTEEVV